MRRNPFLQIYLANDFTLNLVRSFSYGGDNATFPNILCELTYNEVTTASLVKPLLKPFFNSLPLEIKKLGVDFKLKTTPYFYSSGGRELNRAGV